MTQVPVQIEDFIKKQILKNHISKVPIQIQDDDDAGTSSNRGLHQKTNFKKSYF
jgi:hypothetical protein